MFLSRRSQLKYHVGNVDSRDFELDTFGLGAFRPLYIEFRLISCLCLATRGPKNKTIKNYFHMWEGLVLSKQDRFEILVLIK